MSYQWLKLAHNLPEDRKLRSFSIAHKWAWVCLLCVASQSSERGIITDDQEDLIDYCGFDSAQDFLFFLDKLRQKGMIEPIDEGHLKIVNWEKWQKRKPSDEPEKTKERKQKSRAKHKAQAAEDADSCHAHVTPMSRDGHDTDKIRLDETRQDQTKQDPPLVLIASDSTWPQNVDHPIAESLAREGRSEEKIERPKQPTLSKDPDPEETIDSATQQQGNALSSENTDLQDPARAREKKSAALLDERYGTADQRTKAIRINTLRRAGLNPTAAEAIAFHHALLAWAKEQPGLNDPQAWRTSRINAINGRNNRGQQVVEPDKKEAAIAQIQELWALFDGTIIKPQQHPWHGDNGAINPSFKRWLDGKEFRENAGQVGWVDRQIQNPRWVAPLWEQWVAAQPKHSSSGFSAPQQAPLGAEPVKTLAEEQKRFTMAQAAVVEKALAQKVRAGAMAQAEMERMLANIILVDGNAAA